MGHGEVTEFECACGLRAFAWIAFGNIKQASKTRIRAQEELKTGKLAVS